MLLIATLASLLGPRRCQPPAVGACITMNTEKLPLNKRVSPLDSISFKVEKSNVKLCYSRPSLKGRTMIGGEAVPYGKIWRTGSNEPTMIHTDGPLEIAGVKVPAGTYSIYTVPGEKEWEVIVNTLDHPVGSREQLHPGSAGAGGRARQGEGGDAQGPGGEADLHCRAQRREDEARSCSSGRRREWRFRSSRAAVEGAAGTCRPCRPIAPSAIRSTPASTRSTSLAVE